MYVGGRDHVGRDQEAARKAEVAKANEWTAAQAARLDTSPGVIVEAIRERYWLPPQIEEVTNRYTLEDEPPSGLDLWASLVL